MSEQYTYAVARIRALEVSLFSDSTIEQFMNNVFSSYQKEAGEIRRRVWMQRRC